MIGDKIVLKPYYLPPAHDIVDLIHHQITSNDEVFTISISGESGCGKSTLAMAIKLVLEGIGKESHIFHMDDYFKLPPTSNHNQRVEDINNVGPQEVNLELMRKHIADAKLRPVSMIKPLVHYKENDIRQEIIYLNTVDVIIIEGTYTSLLDEVDCKVFIDRTYIDTLQNRSDRAREEMTEFIENVLEIEHQIIKKHKILADVILGKDYSVTKKLAMSSN